MTKTLCAWCANPNPAKTRMTDPTGRLTENLCRDCAGIARGEGWTK